MRILLMAQHYAPEDVSGAVLATELATDLVDRGHAVTFVTCAPNYPKGKVFTGFRNKLYQVDTLDGVRVVRTWSHISSTDSLCQRLLNYGTWSSTAFGGGLLAGKPDLIFSYSPPLPLGVSAWLLSRLWGVPWILRVEDLYPDAAVAAGVLQNSIMIRFFRWLERFLYRQTSHVSLISEGFLRNLLIKGVSPDKLSVTPVWADPNLVRPLPKDNGFRREHGLDSAFVVMYAGALGHTSALEDVMAAAALLQRESRIRFMIIGEGVKKAGLQASAERQGLQNVSFLPYQPRERFPEMLAAADVSLVTLNRRSSSFSLPNKTFNIMASGRPILAVVPEGCEIAELVRETECGVSVSPEQPDQLRLAILELANAPERLEAMGYNGRHAVEARFDRDTCVSQIVGIMAQLAQ